MEHRELSYIRIIAIKKIRGVKVTAYQTDHCGGMVTLAILVCVLLSKLTVINCHIRETDGNLKMKVKKQLLTL